MEQVKKFLGHSTIRVTSDSYGHLYDGHEEPVMVGLDARRRRAVDTSGVRKVSKRAISPPR